MEFLSDIGGGSDTLRPSFFELAAQDQLRDLLPPVVRYILSVFAQRNPRYLLRILNRHDELFALVMFFVERHYLTVWGASFAENFYGLKRRRVIGTSGENTKEAVALTGESEKLRPKEIRSSLLFLILVPYLRSKAQEAYEVMGGGVDEELFRDAGQSRAHQQQLAALPFRERMTVLFKHYFKKFYPYANVAYEVWLLAYNVGYLFDKTPYWRPWLSWMKVEVRRMSGDDYRAAEAATSTLLASPLRRDSGTGLRPAISTILLRSLALAPKLTFEALKFLLPTSIFFFRFLEWWYSSEGGYSRLRKKGGSGSNVPPALRAPPAKKGGGGKKAPPKKGICVVHEDFMVNPTALPTGWLGCYKCLHTWVEENGTCPVEGSKVELSELRKIVG